MEGDRKDGVGEIKHTAATKIEDLIIRLNIQPLHNFGRELWDKGGCVLVFLYRSLIYYMTSSGIQNIISLASEDQLSWISLVLSPIVIVKRCQVRRGIRGFRKFLDCVIVQL
jgi:hypothetical protein